MPEERDKIQLKQTGNHFTIKRNEQQNSQNVSESDDGENDDENYNENMEAVVCRCSSKQVFLKILQI